MKTERDILIKICEIENQLSKYLKHEVPISSIEIATHRSALQMLKWVLNDI